MRQSNLRCWALPILHVKLALEHSNKNTLPCRKEVIRAEILRLRMERDRILERRV